MVGRGRGGEVVAAGVDAPAGWVAGGGVGSTNVGVGLRTALAWVVSQVWALWIGKLMNRYFMVSGKSVHLH